MYHSPFILYSIQSLSLRKITMVLGYIERWTYKTSLFLAFKNEFSKKKKKNNPSQQKCVAHLDLMRYSGSLHSTLNKELSPVYPPLPSWPLHDFPTPHIWIKLLMRKQGTETKVSGLHRKSGGRLGSHFQQPIQKSHLSSLSGVLYGQTVPKQVSEERERTSWFAHLKKTHMQGINF